jgi:hypothetical protein
MERINKERAKELIEQSNNKIFTAEFIKKDGSHRLMNARLGVKKGLKENPKAQPYEPSKYNLIGVYDMQINKYRMINLNTLKKLSINKIRYKIISDEEHKKEMAELLNKAILNCIELEKNK